MGVRYWGYFISSKAWCITAASWQLWKRAVILDSAANSRTFIIRLQSVQRGPLGLGGLLVRD